MPEPLTPLARRLRRDATHAERKVWNMLRERPLGFKFRRQQPVEGFIADFACFEVKLVIEIDGGQHFDSVKDAARTAKLEAAGWTVIRFWNVDVHESMDGIYDRIEEALRALKHVQQPPHPADDFQD
jgi:very-short-patch-repair endonuclease